MIIMKETYRGYVYGHGAVCVKANSYDEAYRKISAMLGKMNIKIRWEY